MYDNKRFALSIGWIILGIILMVLSITDVLESSMYSGMGGALIAIGVLQTMRHLKYRRDPEYREKIDTEFSDERYSFLRMKSWSWAGYCVVLIESVGAVIAMILGQTLVQQVLMYSVCLIVFVYWLSFMVLNRKY